MKTLRKKIKVTVEKTDTGFSAYCNDYPVYTTGEKFIELLENVVEALNLFLEDQKVHIKADNIEFQLDLKQFFQYYRVINSKFLAQRIGMNETLLSQYVQGRKKPSSNQTQKILHGIQEIGRELSNLNLFL